MLSDPTKTGIFIERAKQEVFALAKGKRFSMSVPVDEERDSDRVLIRALEEAQADLSRLKEEKAALEARLREKGDLRKAGGTFGGRLLADKLADTEAQVATLEAEGKRLKEALQRLSLPTVSQEDGSYRRSAWDDENLEAWMRRIARAALSSTPSLAAAVERQKAVVDAVPQVYKAQMKVTGWSHFEMSDEWKPLLLAWMRATGTNPWDFFGAEEGVLASEYERALDEGADHGG